VSLADRLLSELAFVGGQRPQRRKRPEFELPDLPTSPLPVGAPVAPGRRSPPVRPGEPAAPAGGSGSVVYVGDSMGVGTAPHVRGRENVVGGRSSASGVDALRRLLGRRDADTVIFDLGTNDQGRVQLADSLRRARRLAGEDTRIVVPTVRGHNAGQKNRLIHRLGDRGLIDVVEWARAPDRLVSGDRIHATPGGYRRRAGMIRRFL
jgi:hypothetical protein